MEATLALLRAAVGDATGGSDEAARADLARDPGRLPELVARLRQDRSFDLLPAELQDRLAPDPIHQTHELVGRRIHTVTTVRLSGVSAEPLRDALLASPWTWWRHGRISGWTREEGGGVRFALWPVWLRSPARVGIELSAPVAGSESGWGITSPKEVVAARFSGDFDGPGAYETLPVRGGCVLRSIWDGVAPRGLVALMPVSSILKVHLGAEAGTLAFPFRRGTGFPGLLDRLGARPAAP